MRTVTAACTHTQAKLSSEEMMEGGLARMGCGLLVCLWPGMERAIRDRLQPRGNLCKAALTLEDVPVKWVPIRQ